MTNDHGTATSRAVVTRYEETRDNSGELTGVSGSVHAVTDSGDSGRTFAFEASARDGLLLLDTFGPHSGGYLRRPALWAFAGVVRDLRGRGHTVDTGPIHIDGICIDGAPSKPNSPQSPPTDTADGADTTKSDSGSDSAGESVVAGDSPPADKPLDYEDPGHLAWAYEREATITDAVEWFDVEYDTIYQALVKHGLHVPGNTNGEAETELLAALADAGGELSQPELIDAVGWSRSKVRQVLDRLEGSGDAERVSHGRKNVVRMLDDSGKPAPENAAAQKLMDRLGVGPDGVVDAFDGATSLTDVMRALDVTDRDAASTLADHLGLLDAVRATGAIDRQRAADAVSEVSD